MPCPSPGLERSQRLARALVSSVVIASPEPWSRAQSTSRPSPGLERNLRFARALVSCAINTSPEPWSRARSTLPPSPSLGARLPTHDQPYCGHDVVHAFAHAAAENDPHYSNNSCPCYALPPSLWVRPNKGRDKRC